MILNIVCIILYLWLDCTTGRAIDENMASFSPNHTLLAINQPQYGTEILVEQDMIVTADQYYALYGHSNTFNSSSSKIPARKKRKALRDLSSRWTSKRITYRIQPNTFSDSEEATIKMAIKDWETYTCITFQLATSGDSNFINFKNGSSCRSHMGMQTGPQFIELGESESFCRWKETILHEIGHAVGFVHEQNRPDRDEYVIIKEENLQDPNAKINFGKYDESVVSTYGVPYDYLSIMHYHNTAFAAGDEYTIVTKDPKYQDLIGNREGLSFYDIKLANLMYNCSESCNTPIKCPEEGFLGKDCQCWCSGDPIEKCGTTN